MHHPLGYKSSEKTSIMWLSIVWQRLFMPNTFKCQKQKASLKKYTHFSALISSVYAFLEWFLINASNKYFLQHQGNGNKAKNQLSKQSSGSKDVVIRLMWPKCHFAVLAGQCTETCRLRSND